MGRRTNRPSVEPRPKAQLVWRPILAQTLASWLYSFKDRSAINLINMLVIKGLFVLLFFVLGQHALVHSWRKKDTEREGKIKQEKRLIL